MPVPRDPDSPSFLLSPLRRALLRPGAALLLGASLCLSAAGAPAPAQTARLRAGHQVTYVTPGVAPQGAVVRDTSRAGRHYYAVTGAFGAMTLHRIDADAPASPSLVATGAADLVGADDQLDAAFGSIGGLAVLAGGELVIVDNGVPSSGGPGDRIFLARDLNSDGDFRDVVAGQPEVVELIAKATLDALTGTANFSGAAVHVPPAGHPFAGDLFVQTSDGGGASEVLRIDDPAGTPAATLFAVGGDFGGGLASDAGGLLAGWSSFPGGGSIVRLVDGDASGDALGVGETTTLYAGTLDGCSALALTNGGDLLVAAFRPDFSGSEFFLASATVAEEATRPLFTPDDFIYAGDVVLDGAGSFAAYAGPGGQQAVMAIDGRLAFVEPAADPGVATTDANYHLVSLAPPDAARPWSGAVAAIPGAPASLLAAAGPFGAQEVWRVEVADPLVPTYRRVAAGAADLAGGDGVADSGFGSIAALVALPGGDVVVVDNFDPFSGGPGDRLFRLRDGDADGDFFAPSEVGDLIAVAALDALTGQANFTGAAATLGADGALYVVTADGPDASEVLRIADPAGTPAGALFFADGALGGIDYGGGIASESGRLSVADIDAAFGVGADRLWRLADLTADGDALDGAGEATLQTSAFAGATQLAAGPADTLWRTRGFFGSAVEWIGAGDGGAVVRTVATTATSSFGGLAFLSAGGATFEPATGSTDRLIVQSSDFGFPVENAFLHLVWPDPAVPVGVSVFALD